MDKRLEELFVKNFVKKDRQERILFELFSSKKRQNGINNLLCSLNEKKIVFAGSKIKDDEFKELVFKNLNFEHAPVYIITNDSWDGLHTNFEDAFVYAMNGCWSYVIICDEKVAFAKSEVEYGSPQKFLLINK